MGALADSYAILKSGTLWSSTGKCQGYGVANANEAKLVDAYVAALDSGDLTATPPVLSTKTGRGLVGMLHALAAPAPPPVKHSLAIVGTPRVKQTLEAAVT